MKYNKPQELTPEIIGALCVNHRGGAIQLQRYVALNVQA